MIFAFGTVQLLRYDRSQVERNRGRTFSMGRVFFSMSIPVCSDVESSTPTISCECEILRFNGWLFRIGLPVSRYEISGQNPSISFKRSLTVSHSFFRFVLLICLYVNNSLGERDALLSSCSTVSVRCQSESLSPVSYVSKIRGIYFQVNVSIMCLMSSSKNTITG